MENAFHITDIAIVAVVASLLGILMVKSKQPAVIGYIITGSVLGPAGFGFVNNQDSIALLAELGVILLLYFIGMEMSLRGFKKIWKLALFTTIAQIIFSIMAMLGFAKWFGWTMQAGLLLGLCLSLSSTAVAVKVMENIGALRTSQGQVVISILIAQDLAVAPMLLLIGDLQPHITGSIVINPLIFVKIIIAVIILYATIQYLTRRQRLLLPFADIVSKGGELAPLVSIGFCFACAAMCGIIGLSPAFGAFLAGLIIGNSTHRAVFHQYAEPIQAILLMVFFLSVGMLLDGQFMLENLATVLFLWAFVKIFKTCLNILLLKIQNQSWRDSFLESLALGQIGEFSFILAAAAVHNNIIDMEQHKLIVAVTVLSLATSPLYIDAMRRLNHRSMIHYHGVLGQLRIAYFKEMRITKHVTLYLRIWAVRILRIILARLNKWDQTLRNKDTKN